VREDIFRKAVQAVLRPNAREPVNFAGRPSSKNLFYSGTTVLALQYDGGVLCAGDRKATAGYSILSDDTNKVQQVGMLSMVGGAGLVSAIQYVRKTLQERNSSFFGRAGIPLSLSGQANFLSSLLRGLRLSNIDDDFYSCFILAGREIGENSFDIYEIDGAGGQHSCRYTSIGSGSESVLPVLKDRRHGWRPQMKLKAALDLTFRALYTAGKLDAMTSDSEVTLPTMAIVDGRGFRYVKPKTIERLRRRHMEKKS
jgi:proteasome beta subunit